MRTEKEIQQTLAGLGLYTGAIDGILGAESKTAIRAFQRINGLTVDGVAGKNTQAKLFVDAIDHPELSISDSRWPKQRDMREFYGKPGANHVKIVTAYPMTIAWDKRKKIPGFTVNERCAEEMQNIFRLALDHYGIDEIQRLGLDLYGGCYNNRKMRGGKNLSTHAYACAVDIDPARNRLRWRADRAELAKPAYEAWWEIVESQGAVSLGRAKGYDWMHFQFAR
jgi:hypothetical protein